VEVPHVQYLLFCLLEAPLQAFRGATEQAYVHSCSRCLRHLNERKRGQRRWAFVVRTMGVALGAAVINGRQQRHKAEEKRRE